MTDNEEMRKMSINALLNQMELLWDEGFNFDAICYRLRGGVMAAIHMGNSHKEVEEALCKKLEELIEKDGRKDVP